jgi:hypothetical protein
LASYPRPGAVDRYSACQFNQPATNGCFIGF